MADYLRAETIATWVGDFLETSAFASMPAPAKEYAEQILPAFLERACAVRDVAPADLEEGDMKPALLEELERQGRLGGGGTLAKYVRALADAFAGGPIRNPGSRIGRNDPCPCGSGRKYKQCCLNREP